MRAGDVVHHEPTGETWLLAWAENLQVCAMGWPETVAALGDCTLIKAASDEEHRKALTDVVESGVGDHGYSYRYSVARRQL